MGYQKVEVNNNSIGFCGLLTIVFIALKLWGASIYRDRQMEKRRKAREGKTGGCPFL